MTIRTPAILAVVAVLGYAADNRISAQPLAPVRPPNNAFGNFFGPGNTVVPNAGMNINGLPRQGGFGPNSALAPGLGSQNNYGPFAPYILSMQPVVFNNRGHWYSNYYSHWYPNGLTNGVGVLSNGGTSGNALRFAGGAGNSAFGVGAVLPGSAGMPGAMPGPAGMPAAVPGAMPIMPGFGLPAPR
jgi:hypothetical protein